MAENYVKPHEGQAEGGGAKGTAYVCGVCQKANDPNLKVCTSCGAKFDGILYDAEKEYEADYLMKNPPKYVTEKDMSKYREAVGKATHEGKKKVKFIVVASLFKKLKEAA